MITYICIFLLLFLIFISSYFLRKFFIYRNILDKVSVNKIHSTNTPKGLGLILTPFLITFLFILFYSFDWIYLYIPRLYFLVISMFIFYLISSLDDWFDLNAYFKLFVQLSIIYFSLSTLPLNFKEEINYFTLTSIYL